MQMNVFNGYCRNRYVGIHNQWNAPENALNYFSIDFRIAFRGNAQESSARGRYYGRT